MFEGDHSNQAIVQPALPTAIRQQLEEIMAAPAAEILPELRRLCRENPAHEEKIRRSFERMTTSPAQSSETSMPSDQPATGLLGLYRIVDILGEGGMGTVFLAEQMRPFVRKVALKVVRQGINSDVERGRFAAERDALARMSHNNIAKVFDVGANEQGQPYFVMEYVDGLPIHEHCDRHGLNLERRLQLFLQVCEGVQHAHQKGIIHRDLKPSNILVSSEQEIPKIIDFGVSRTLENDLNRDHITLHGQVVGTLGYMAPEQADLRSKDVDSRVDVYSLGVVLYELLVGALPIQVADIADVGFGEVQRRIREQKPFRPSAVVATRSKRRAHELAMSERSLRQALRSDLDWILLKALEKDRNLRYGTANELAADIQRFLSSEPVSAGPPRLGYRLRRLVNRYYTQLIAGAALGFVLVAVCLLYLWAAAAQHADELADAKRQTAEQIDLLMDSREHEQQALARSRDLLARVHTLRLEPELRAARELEATLYPCWPENAHKLETWLERYGRPLELARAEVDAALLRLNGIPAGPLAESAAGTSKVGEFLRDRLLDLSFGLDAFCKTGALVRVKRGLAHARRVRERTVDRHASAWHRAIETVVAQPHYRGLRLKAQTGMVPLGLDSVTGLMRFRHEFTGVEFLLVPALGIEAPRFIATAELTEAQRRRLLGASDEIAIADSDLRLALAAFALREADERDRVQAEHFRLRQQRGTWLVRSVR